MATKNRLIGWTACASFDPASLCGRGVPELHTASFASAVRAVMPTRSALDPDSTSPRGRGAVMRKSSRSRRQRRGKVHGRFAESRMTEVDAS